MNLYVYTNVLRDYTGGMVLIAASSIEEAFEYAVQNFFYGDRDNQEDWANFQEKNPGFFSCPISGYKLAVDTNPGVQHYIWGGA